MMQKQHACMVPACPTSVLSLTGSLDVSVDLQMFIFTSVLCAIDCFVPSSRLAVDDEHHNGRCAPAGYSYSVLQSAPHAPEQSSAEIKALFVASLHAVPSISSTYGFHWKDGDGF